MLTFAPHRKCLALGLILLLLSGSMSFPLSPQAARAQDTCGDNICSALEKTGGCPLDCGAYRGYCGNRVCERNENCSTCSEDCGWCATRADQDEDLSKEDREPPVICGDNVCSSSEGCRSCPGDCGACPATWQGKLLYQFRRTVRLVRHFLWKSGRLLTVQSRRALRDTFAYLQKQQSVLQENAVERSRAAQHLQRFLQEHPALAGDISVFQKGLIDRVSRQDRVGVLNSIPSVLITQATQKAVRRDTRRIARLMNALLQHPGAREWLEELPAFPALVDAVERENLQQAATLLPPPRRSLQELSEQLDLLETLLQDQRNIRTQSSLLWETALAQGRQSVTSHDPQAEFERAMDLMQRMKKEAWDREAALPTLDDRLTYLQERKTVLAGIVNFPGDYVGEQLNEVQSGLHTPSTQTLINFMGIFRYLRTTANFTALEESWTHAIFRMRSGFGNFLSLFLRDVPPRAEAAGVLLSVLPAKALQTFKGEDLARQKEIMQDLLTKQKGELQPLLGNIPADEQRMFEERFRQTQSRVAEAKHLTDMRLAMEEWGSLVEELQGNIRSARNRFFRLIYVLQDFFGRP